MVPLKLSAQNEQCGQPHELLLLGQQRLAGADPVLGRYYRVLIHRAHLPVCRTHHSTVMLNITITE